MQRLPNLIWLRSFEAAARLLNFTEAGKELGLTQTAVSLHIKALEETLQCQLFRRNPRHLALTDVGEAYAMSVRAAIGEMNLATVSLFGPATTQTLTVRAPISTVSLWLAPRLPAFMAAHPDINLRLVSTIWASSAGEEDVDIDIKLATAGQIEPGAERLSTETVVPVADADAGDLTGRPDLLLAAPLIRILGYEDSWANYIASLGISGPARGKRLSVDTTAAALALAAAGGGRAMIVTRFARQAIASGARIRLAGAPIPFAQAHFLAQGARTAPRKPEAELFAAWLRAAFDEDRDLP
ncbi:LysR family transcriptional regulator [Frigidibacter sp. SD6-1]|uniref:LysR family transcriptional regulator n=1 Tax=Frigidibacter sp. SD6-1 TaxID=3032581 RepID=UPI0024DFC7F1|nr:LysR family transcriptional regulator [Frigidibacter sp. SD6-1]